MPQHAEQQFNFDLEAASAPDHETPAAPDESNFKMQLVTYEAPLTGTPEPVAAEPQPQRRGGIPKKQDGTPDLRFGGYRVQRAADALPDKYWNLR